MPVPQRARQAVLATGGGSSLAEATPAAALTPVFDRAAVAEGASFSDKLNRASCTVGGLVATGHLMAQDTEAALLAVAVHVRQGHEHRTLRIIRSGMLAGSRRPLELGDRR
ncbi:hypothetical protein [Streptomyces sp. NPDC002785]|uniref:hypothetical protein n=1 Tax=Streptomyces sp. NPDC002785 TaxID=3154543 RepID=UPI00332E34AC